MFVKKILFIVIKNFLLRLTYICCKFNFINLQYFILIFFISKYRFANKYKKTILIVRKSAGFEDVLISLNVRKIDKNILILPRFILKKIFTSFLSENFLKINIIFT